MYRPRKLIVLIAILLMIHLGFAGGSPMLQQVKAATNGPIVQAYFPADNMTEVPLGLNLRILFDESVKRGPSTTYFHLYKTSGNELVESFSATSGRIAVSSSNPREVSIDPTSNLEPSTAYYVLIDGGALLNVSNNAPFAGIQNATVWNFTTTDQSVPDTTKPTLGATPNLIPAGAGASITTDLIIRFSEPVYAAEGNITLSSSFDTRVIPVTSSNVLGSGTDTITIKPDTALLPNTSYTVEVTNVNFQDAAGNTFNGIGGATWSFQTTSAPINLAAVNPLSPANQSSQASISAPLTIRFDQPVQANAGKYIEIRRVSDNALFQTRIAATSTVVSGDTVTINHNTFASGTSYYVLIESGAFSQVGQPNEWYPGITEATVWTFTTGNDTTPPAVTTYVPARNGQASGTNTKLELTFNEPVYPNSGTIEIRTSVGNTLFRSIPLTSERVTGGGTNKLTIDANRAISGEAAKSFVNNTRYYVTIGNGAIRDASGNLFAGISGTSGWSFTITNDQTPPQLVSLSPTNNSNVVPTSNEEHFSATFSEPIFVDSATQLLSGSRILIYPPSGSPLAASFRVDPNDSKKVLIKPGAVLDANRKYYINIEPGAITDLAGNPFVGILNQHQWVFTTIGGDTTPPAVTKTEASGSSIRIIYGEPLKESEVPTAANYYVTVAGTPRNVTAVKVEGNMVVLTLQSSASNSQKVEVSYTRPGSTANYPKAVQDLSGNLAPSFSNVTANNGFTGNAPTLTGSSASGSIVTLTFSETLASVSSNAYTQFTVNVGGTNRTPTAIWQSGNTVQLTLPVTITSGQTVRVSYSPSSYPLKGAASGNNASSFSNHTVGSITGGGSNDTTPPVIISATALDSILTLTYNETLDSSSAPSIYQYNVTVNNSQRTVTGTVVAGNRILLTLGSPVSSGQTIRVTYYGSSSTVKDAAGNAAASFSNMAATYGESSGGGTGQGDLRGAIVKGSALTLNFSEALSPYNIPQSTMFIVRVNNQIRYVTDVEVSGSSAILRLAAAVKPGEAVTVTYNGGDTGLKTLAGTTVNGFSNTNVANQTTLIDSLPSNEYESAVGGGVVIKSAGATATSDTSPAGVSTNRYNVYNDRVITAVVTARDAGLTSPRILFRVPDHERAALASFPLSTLELAKQQGGNNVTIGVQHGDATFEIPLSSLDFSALSRMAGGTMSSNQLVLAIDTGANSKTTQLTSAINNSGSQVIVGPYHYEVLVMNGMSKQNVTNINGFLTRTVKLPGPVTSSQTAAVWYDPVVGALSYVPTTIKTENGETWATFKRKGTSAYAIVRNTATFSDLGTHWAASAVNTMSRKFIVDGKTATTFAPNQSITRGEFAAYISKGLGLGGDRAAAAKFTDVNASTTMGAYIGAAAGNDIIAGITSTSFGPNNYITRQDMAIIMLRAAKAAGMTISMPGTADSYLQPYNDRTKISSYAKTAMAQAVYAGFINGQSPTSLNPLGNATRAEATVMIMRLLQKSDLLTP